MFYHLADYCPVSSPFSATLKQVLSGGRAGVDLFFVLSGFLITGILLDTRRSPNYFRVFYARRILRIFPLYYCSLITVFGIARFWPPLAAMLPNTHDQLFYFVYLNNWWVLLRAAWHPNLIGHFWTLAVEEQFYLLWPFIVWRWARKQVEFIALFGIFFALFIRIAVFAIYGPVRDLIENPFCRMDSVLMGALLASLVRRRELPDLALRRFFWISIATAVALIASGFSRLLVCQVALSPIFVFSGLAVVFGSLVSRVFLGHNSQTILQTIMRSRLLTFCGKYSYGMYVYHIPLLWLAVRHFTDMKPTSNLATFSVLSCAVILLTLVIAKTSFDYFEMRFLKWKKKFISELARA